MGHRSRNGGGALVAELLHEIHRGLVFREAAFTGDGGHDEPVGLMEHEMVRGFRCPTGELEHPGDGRRHFA